MKFIASFILLFPLVAFAQSENPLKVYYDRSEDGGLEIFADNAGYCPYTIDLKMELKNMESKQGNALVMVIPAQTTKQSIATVNVKDKTKASSFGLKSAFYLGDATKKPPLEQTYALPFRKGDTHLMSQGYNGSFSHNGKYAIDFNMDIGTDICAARDGVVVEVKENSNRGCPSRKCLDDANNIILYHDDGTFTEYAHLKKNGAKVRIGDRVREGEVIGLSGNTGFSSGPHLHFEVFFFDMATKKTMATRFKTGNKAEYLKEKVSYTAP